MRAWSFSTIFMQECQKRALCLKHALNNLSQRPQFSKKDLDRIAKVLPRQGFRILNPHKSLFLGDYDVVGTYVEAVQPSNKL